MRLLLAFIAAPVIGVGLAIVATVIVFAIAIALAYIRTRHDNTETG